jgi:hypothetical protein
MRPLKIGSLVVGALMVVTLSTLRVTGLEPGHPSAQEYAQAGRSARPGLWLTGEVVREAVTNWDWVDRAIERQDAAAIAKGRVELDSLARELATVAAQPQSQAAADDTVVDAEFEEGDPRAA